MPIFPRSIAKFTTSSHLVIEAINVTGRDGITAADVRHHGDHGGSAQRREVSQKLDENADYSGAAAAFGQDDGEFNLI